MSHLSHRTAKSIKPRLLFGQKGQVFRQKRPEQGGFTLVELLVVMAIGLIVAAVAFGLYRVNSDYYLQTDDEIQRQQNLRAATFVMTRDLRMAGSGIFLLGSGVKRVQAYVPFSDHRQCGESMGDNQLDWFSHCDSRNVKGVRAIFVEDGGADNSDIVTIFRAAPEFSGVVGEVASYQSGTISLTNSVNRQAVEAGDIMALAKDNEAVIFEALEPEGSGELINQIKINLKGRFTGPTGIAPNFPVMGSAIYNLKDVTLVTYYVDEDEDKLMALTRDQKVLKNGATKADPILVADRVEDLQIYPHFENEIVDPARISQTAGLNSSKLDQYHVRAVSLGISVKSLRKVGKKPLSRPAFFNRRAGTKLDNFNRSSIVSVIQLRNYER
ncbi:MAG: prepilin-type N-terminal cleavage/methylation domain-containing protein [Deltaproteobacteria bacterium]|jgi:prepilin-type N-terminal cleavage/methylation domain-containing protein|nr:prepilin-type N-terminal cleavage/methylation domain-containing protein [Deltaproteobacteria bacterium]